MLLIGQLKWICSKDLKKKNEDRNTVKGNIWLYKKTKQYSRCNVGQASVHHLRHDRTTETQRFEVGTRVDPPNIRTGCQTSVQVLPQRAARHMRTFFHEFKRCYLARRNAGANLIWIRIDLRVMFTLFAAIALRLRWSSPTNHWFKFHKRN